LPFPFTVIKQLTFIGADVLCQRLDPGFYCVLFHHNILKSDFVSEQVVVENISLLFGIDLAGDKVINDQIMYEEPSYEEKELKKYRDFSCMFCNISRKKTLEEEETLLQDGTIETSDVELKDTFFG
jgi:hypothetical protein